MLLDVGLDIFKREFWFGDGGEASDPVGDRELGDELRGRHERSVGRVKAHYNAETPKELT